MTETYWCHHDVIHDVKVNEEKGDLSGKTFVVCASLCTTVPIEKFTVLTSYRHCKKCVLTIEDGLPLRRDYGFLLPVSSFKRDRKGRTDHNEKRYQFATPE